MTDKPRRNSGNQFSLATTETWKIIAERLRKKETEGVVRGGDSSYQPRLACKPELTKLIVLGGRKSLGTMRHLNWLNADKLQRYTQPPVTLSLYFPSPCLRFLFSPVLVTTIGRNHSDLRLSGGFKRENGIIRKVFPRQFLRPRHREAFHEFSFAKTISCRACKRLVWHIRVSICLVGVFLSSDLSNFFLERRKSVSSSFLFEYACNWEIENCFSRSISCIAERESI